ncbi:cyclic lactone autoinducer peptide [Alkaliphilus metalliredigens]|nr:cyclic lactone autoinducer peptide [Alkaliphilus metalliredigens]
MNKRVLMLLAGFATTVLTLAANTITTSACAWGVYQPKEPKLLRK